MTETLRLFAPAKVNLFLHVVRRLPNGYHELESLIVFAEIGDELSVADAEDIRLSIAGPFAPLLANEPLDSNLVYRAAAVLKERAGKAVSANRGAALTLTKSLPVASGIGGGSADAAAALRLLQTHWNADIPESALQALGLDLGADIPVCLVSRPAYVTGIGEHLARVPRLPDAYLVLVNSGTPVPTGPVFKGLDPDAMPGMLGPAPQPEDYGDLERFVAALKNTRNDLEASAIQVAPDIAQVLEALSGCPGCLLARMSGSGGTCFGLFADKDQAEDAVRAIAQDQPGWWAAAGRLLQDAPEPVSSSSQ